LYKTKVDPRVNQVNYLRERLNWTDLTVEEKINQLKDNLGVEIKLEEIKSITGLTTSEVTQKFKVNRDTGMVGGDQEEKGKAYPAVSNLKTQQKIYHLPINFQHRFFTISAVGKDAFSYVRADDGETAWIYNYNIPENELRIVLSKTVSVDISTWANLMSMKIDEHGVITKQAGDKAEWELHGFVKNVDATEINFNRFTTKRFSDYEDKSSLIAISSNGQIMVLKKGPNNLETPTFNFLKEERTLFYFDDQELSAFDGIVRARGGQRTDITFEQMEEILKNDNRIRATKIVVKNGETQKEKDLAKQAKAQLQEKRKVLLEKYSYKTFQTNGMVKTIMEDPKYKNSGYIVQTLEVLRMYSWYDDTWFDWPMPTMLTYQNEKKKEKAAERGRPAWFLAVKAKRIMHITALEGEKKLLSQIKKATEEEADSKIIDRLTEKFMKRFPRHGKNVFSLEDNEKIVLAETKMVKKLDNKSYLQWWNTEIFEETFGKRENVISTRSKVKRSGRTTKVTTKGKELRSILGMK